MGPGLDAGPEFGTGQIKTGAETNNVTAHNF